VHVSKEKEPVWKTGLYKGGPPQKACPTTAKEAGDHSRAAILLKETS